ncbi:MAG: DUF6776 family protein [Halioglobus sp.]
MLLTLMLGIYLGRHSAYSNMQIGSQSVRGLQSELANLRAELQVAQGDLQMQRTRHEVDSRALELVRSEMAAEKNRTAELEEGLSFYRSMMVSEDNTSGLSVRKPELVPGVNPGQVGYRIFVQQKEREFDMVEGTLSVDILGVKAGKEISYPLSRLSKQFGAGGETLHFRYFQAIEGELDLPEGFEPRGIMLVVRASKPRESKVRQEFPWELQERFINVGK